jgi:large subunit ribosomal protein L31e
MMERIYTIPLRQGTLKAPRTRRAKKAIFVLKDFIKKHMKSEDIAISETLNEHIWQNGMRNPILKVKVVVTKDDKNKVTVKLFGEKTEAPAEEKKPVVKKTVPKKAEAKKESSAEKDPKTEKVEESKDSEAKPVEEKKTAKKTTKKAKVDESTKKEE